MNDERWYDLVDMIRTKFGLLREEQYPHEHGPGKIEVVEFEGAMGRMKLERVTRPVVLERKTRFSKRIGAEASEEFVYAPGEFSHRVSLYRWVDGLWQEEDYRSFMR